MSEVIITSVISFLTTNIDDIFILMVLYAQASGQMDRVRIAAGRYLGTLTLLGVSVLGVFGTSVLSPEVIGLLGLVPIYLGVKSYKEYREEAEKEDNMPDIKRITIMESAFLTIANGADNIGVYIPVFSGFSMADLTVMVVIFMILTAGFCLAGDKLANQRFMKAAIQKYEQILVPAVLVILGVMILTENYLWESFGMYF